MALSTRVPTTVVTSTGAVTADGTQLVSPSSRATFFSIAPAFFADRNATRYGSRTDSAAGPSPATAPEDKACTYSTAS